MNVSFSIVESVDWAKLDSFPDRTLFQTKPWLDFVVEAQHASPVILEAFINNQPVGFFTGLIVKTGGVRILGSPFPGWTTSYLGFNLNRDIDRSALLEPLAKFAFRELGCWHVELMDRHLTVPQVDTLGWKFRLFQNTEIDLAPSEEDIWDRLKGSCRT
ncbi:amino-acid racemase, partial [candidate division GN15 bacterium]